MNITAFKTPILKPKGDLPAVIKLTIDKIAESSILVITSKVVSLWENRIIQMRDVKSKDELIKKEAEKYLDRALVPGSKLIHTIKNNLLIPSAGIDESKANGYYILWPERPKESAKKIHSELKTHFRLKNFGVIVSDSHTIPLRRGVIGISLSHFGFEPLKDYRDVKELKDKNYSITQGNLADALAAAAVAVMGEGNEQTPLAIISDIPFIKFTEKEKKKKRIYSSFEVPPEEDLYSPFLKNAPWQKGGK
jgi:F420-0:gamma-glutamyl ligase